MALDIRYAKSGDVSIAYSVLGEGPMDLVVVPGFITHLEISFENVGVRRLAERLAKFARVIVFDKRGTGLSDPVSGVPTLEERMDDVRAVMDAVGSEQAALIGISEGGPMCILFAATYPARTRALVLFGAMARSTWAPDYPWATPREALMESAATFFTTEEDPGAGVEYFAPSLAGDPEVRAWYAKVGRYAASPGMLASFYLMFLDIDVRAELPLVQAPTLVLHRRGDRIVNVGAGRYLAEHIKGAKYVELAGRDHAVWAGDVDALMGEIEEFLTGARVAPPEEVERVLATVMFTDVVGSTERASELGDKRWRELLERYYEVGRGQVERNRGRVVKTIGDGMLATFDGPGRAIKSAMAIAADMHGLGLEVRAGLHAGECEIMGEDVGGIAVHIGARISAQAGPGEVLVSSTVKDLVAGSGITFLDRGSHTLKGVPGEWKIFAVEG